MKNFVLKILLIAVISIITYISLAYLSGKLFNEPILTTSVSFDKKMQFLKNSEAKRVNVLAIGSSMTLNNLNSKTIESRYEINGKYLNLGAWGLQMSDIYKLVKYFSEKYCPKIIIVSMSLTDFEIEGSYFSLPNDILMDFYFEKNNFLLFLNNMNLNSFLERKLELENSKNENYDYKCLNYDNYGGVFLDVPKEKIDTSRWNRSIKEPKESQYKALENIVRYLGEKNIKLALIQCPIKLRPLTAENEKRIIDKHLIRLSQILNGTDNYFINANMDNDYSDFDFCDTYHLNKNAAEKFTERFLNNVDLSEYFNDQ